MESNLSPRRILPPVSLVLLTMLVWAKVCGSASHAFGQTSLVNVATAPGGLWHTRTVAVSGGYAFTANENGIPYSGLRIFNVSNPTNPIPVYGDESTWCGSVAVSDHFAYAIYGDGLHILDVSNPTNPVPVGQIPGSWFSVAAAAQRVYLADLYNNVPVGIAIYDVSDPANPIALGHVATGITAQNILVLGDYAYIAARDNGLLICDVFDARHPKIVGQAITGDALDVAVAGNYAYVANYTNGLSIHDISDPTNPVTLSSGSGFQTFSVAVSGNYVYLSSGYGLSVGDVSTGTNTTRLATAPLPGYSGGYEYPHMLTISGAYAYVANNNGMSIYSLGRPSSPLLRIVGTTTNTLVLSWATPSPAFLVQENTRLDRANWITLTNAPTTVQLQNQIVISPPSATTKFYRLVSE
jgi:hypothetical protein